MTHSNSDTCTIHNVRIDHHFTTTVNSTWEDPRLSFRAKGVLIYILSRPPNWSIHTWQLANVYQGDGSGNGIEALKVVMKELRDLGYVVYSKTKDKNGHWIHRYDTYPVPYDKFKIMFPEGEKPAVVKPAVVNPPVIINNELPRNELDRSKDHIAQTAEKRPSYEITFSFENSKFEGIEKNDLDSWKDLYPAVDIVKELKRMREWIISNQAKTKSKKKWRQFINNWLRKTNDMNLNKEAYEGVKEKPKENDTLGKTKIRFKPNGERYEI